MDEPSTIDAWRLVQLKPNCLAIAQRNLLRQGFRIFCPMEETTQRRRGLFKTVTSPLFPGYLFLGSPEGAAPVRAINSTHGVSRVVSFTNEVPAEVPPEIVAALMARCDAQGLLKPVDALKAGDEITITTGPFANFVGTVQGLAPQQRVWVLLDLLGNLTRVAVKQKSVQKI